MKIILPENQNEITLDQYQSLIKLQDRELDVYSFVKRKVKIFTGLNYHLINSMKMSDLEDIVQNIDIALNQEAKFQPTFKMGNIEFGFIPNFDDIKAKEYFDLTTYDTNPDTLHNLMAILFRQIKNKVGSEYEIENYRGTKEWAEAMKQTPLSIVNGALVFFYNLAKELESYTLKSMAVAQMKTRQQATLRSGAGMQRYTDWLKVRFGSLRTSKN